MRTLATRVVVAVAANAIALALAAALLDRVTIKTFWFVLLVVIFSVISLLVTPLVTNLVTENAPALASVAGLIATYVALLITDLVSDSIQIEGVGTWILATLIVWAATLVVQYVTPRFTGDAPGRRRPGLV